MNQKNKRVQNPALVLKQSKTMKRIGFFLATMSSLTFIWIAANICVKDSASIQDGNVPIFFLVIGLLIWTMVIIPFRLITTRKRIIIKGDKFILKSNKKNCSIDKKLGEIIWWRKIESGKGGEMDFGDKIQIKFSNKKIMLNQLEFQNFYQLEEFLELNLKQKKSNL